MTPTRAQLDEAETWLLEEWRASAAISRGISRLTRGPEWAGAVKDLAYWKHKRAPFATSIRAIRAQRNAIDALLNIEETRALLAEENPNALWPDGLEGAYIGPARRCGQPTIGAFSVSKCIEILMDRDCMTEEDAEEFFEFNVSGAWVGEGTPIWIYDFQKTTE